MRRNKRDLMLSDRDFFFDPIFDNFFTQPRKDYELNRTMSTDIKEKENGYEFEIEMPGFDKKDISLNLDKGYLTVLASTDSCKEQDTDGYLCRERKHGLFSRSYYVGEIKEEDIKAKLENGMLKIFVPKPDKKLISKKQIMIE